MAISTKDLREIDTNSPAMENELEKLTGMRLKDLIRTGRIVRMTGEPFLAAGEELPDDDRKTYSETECKALDAIREGGVFLFDDLESPDPNPRIVFNKGGNMSVTEPLTENKISEAVENVIREVPPPAAVKRPSLLNRTRDLFSRWFGGWGTKEMREYRGYRKALKVSESRRAELTSGTDTIRAYGRQLSKEAARANHTEKTPDEVRRIAKVQQDLYNRMSIKPSEAGNGVRDLWEYARNGLMDLVDQTNRSRINKEEKTEKNMAAMVALDLILKERVANGAKPNENGVVPAGQLEQQLNKVGYLNFIDDMRANPVFRAQIGKVTSKSLETFLSEKGAAKIADHMIHAANPVQQAAEVGPKVIDAPEKEIVKEL